MKLNSIKNKLLMVLVLSAGLSGTYLAGLWLGGSADGDATPCPHLAPDEYQDMVWLPPGEFIMGTNNGYPEEAPMTRRTLAGFWMSKYEVTNAQFAEFVAATGYITDAEKPFAPKGEQQASSQLSTRLSKPGSVVFIMPVDLKAGGSITQWWRFVPGANWRAPLGPGSNIDDKPHHPVVHVSYADALAYADWRGHALPTEAQWEYAARFQQDNHDAGDKGKATADKPQGNIWQGIFPINNLAEDGYVGTAPAGCFAANAAGLHDMLGNVWEWSSDWYYPGHDPGHDLGHAVNGDNALAKGYDPHQPGVAVKVIKGGSYLCAKNYCMRYRPAARHAQEAGLGAAHIGFRTVRNKATPMVK